MFSEIYRYNFQTYLYIVLSFKWYFSNLKVRQIIQQSVHALKATHHYCYKNVSCCFTLSELWLSLELQINTDTKCLTHIRSTNKCYWSTGRSVFGKTVPKGGTQDRAHSFFLIQTDLGWWITFFFFFWNLTKCLRKEPEIWWHLCGSLCFRIVFFVLK